MGDWLEVGWRKYAREEAEEAGVTRLHPSPPFLRRTLANHPNKTNF